MAGQIGRIEGVVAIALILGAVSAAPLTKAQSFAGATTRELGLSNYRAPAGLTGDDVIARMLERNRLRNEQLKRYSAVRTYEIRNPEGKLAAQAVVRAEYQAPDKKTFNKTSEKGSGIVRHLVFDRLIQSESETSSGREHHDSAITSANYTFTLAGEEDLGRDHCFVVEATPKRREKYLFEGKIWIDADDFAVVKIAGHPAKKPSFWINRAEFVRQYQRIAGFWLPFRDETSVEVKMYGKKVFTIDHQQYVINADTPVPGWSGDIGGNMLVAPSATLRP
jgi:outer membrane lipoprotein-sorting protein